MFGGAARFSCFLVGEFGGSSGVFVESVYHMRTSETCSFSLLYELSSPPKIVSRIDVCKIVVLPFASCSTSHAIMNVVARRGT